MLDVRFVIENIGAVSANIKNRNMEANPQRVKELFEERSTLIQSVEHLRQRRNEVAQQMKQKLDPEARTTLIDEGKDLKGKLPVQESRLGEIEEALRDELNRIPNMAHPDAPVGSGEESNRQISRWGDIPSFDFPAQDHLQIAERLDLIDFETAARVSGTKFYYLKNQMVFLDLALVRYALDQVTAHGFTPTITPDIAKEEIVAGTGFQPRGEESNIYTIEGTGTCLVGTAEITLGGYHANQILEVERLPIKLAGLSHCFRKEAGAAGQFSKGLYRVHQFTKVEMFVYCLPEQSDGLHEELRSIEEAIFQGLGIPYRVVDTCTGDLGAPAYRKYDIEAWMPGRGEAGDWGEVTSTSNCTDYQSRRLNVRVREPNSAKNRFVHMLNGTAVATSRALVAILENYQQSDGSVLVPPALVRYTGFDRIAAQ